MLVLLMLATAVADLGFMHATNVAWPPHARFHAVWNVFHVAATHGLALALLRFGTGASLILRTRLSVGIAAAFIFSFFATMVLASLFGASPHPDLPLAERPPVLWGLDGNALGLLFALPLLCWVWWKAGIESSAKK